MQRLNRLKFDFPMLGVSLYLHQCQYVAHRISLDQSNIHSIVPDPWPKLGVKALGFQQFGYQLLEVSPMKSVELIWILAKIPVQLGV